MTRKTTHNLSTISVHDSGEAVKSPAGTINLTDDRNTRIADATSGWRQPCHHPRRTPGRLDILNHEVLGRFLDEGVPEADVLYVAAETHRCVRALEAGEELPEHVHFWTRELLARYEDKAATLFFTTGGGRVVRV